MICRVLFRLSSTDLGQNKERWFFAKIFEDPSAFRLHAINTKKALLNMLIMFKTNQIFAGPFLSIGEYYKW